MSFVATSDNSRHTATLSSAQIRQSQTSYVRNTLAEIPPAAFTRNIGRRYKYAKRK